VISDIEVEVLGPKFFLKMAKTAKCLKFLWLRCLQIGIAYVCACVCLCVSTVKITIYNTHHLIVWFVRRPANKQSVANTTIGVTENLMSLSRMMSSQVKQSEQTMDTLGMMIMLMTTTTAVVLIIIIVIITSLTLCV